jgi:demethylmenaquinone methyltransferase/2-methoxy-6-polyprenyl-1,4-benzoquinol methylase
MFDRVAPAYDLMNSLMTAGLDRGWRDAAARRVVRSGDHVLDAACGTGELALADLRAGAGKVVGLDFSPEMLALARLKSVEVDWVEGDLTQLPFADGTFQAATVGFAVRNIPELGLALSELRRVLAGGGRLAILELTRPRGARAPAYRLWFDQIVPLLGRLSSDQSAYSYLPASVRRFRSPEELAAELARAGFGEIRYRFLAAGIVTLHSGVAR